MQRMREVSQDHRTLLPFPPPPCANMHIQKHLLGLFSLCWHKHIKRYTPILEKDSPKPV